MKCFYILKKDTSSLVFTTSAVQKSESKPSNQQYYKNNIVGIPVLGFSFKGLRMSHFQAILCIVKG